MKEELFENLSLTAGLGVRLLGVDGQARFSSTLARESAAFLESLNAALGCEEAERVALLYGCYQARRFGGRYTFLAPSGLAYCASPLPDERGELTAGVLIGPFLMTDYDEYVDIDILTRHRLNQSALNRIRKGIHAVPFRTPTQARAIGEQLFVCTSYYTQLRIAKAGDSQTDVFSIAYSIEKEDELLAAISIGDIETANAILNYILGQILFHSGNNFEILRSRVVELTVLLSRAALKGGANINAIFGLNYGYLKEIDALSSPEDMTMWLHSVTRRFAQHVFDYADAKHGDVIYKATAFAKQHFAEKISVQDIADAVFLNTAYFSKIFRDETGQTPGNMLTRIRIDESQRLLRDPSVSIVDIPEMIGFESQSYFTKVFKKTVGCTPGDYRRRLNHA